MIGPEDNPRDEQFDQQEYEKWEAEQNASSPQIKREWLAGFHSRDAEIAALERKLERVKVLVGSFDKSAMASALALRRQTFADCRDELRAALEEKE